MSENIEISLGAEKAILLETAGKVCDKNIIVKNDAYDKFWDMFQKNGTRTEYRYAFAYTDWTEEMFKPKYPFKLAGDNTYAFLGVKAVWEDKVFEVDTSEATSLFWLFRLSYFKRIGKCDLSSATAINGMFSFCYNLISIEEIVSHESLEWTNVFDYSTELVEIRFSGVIGKNINFSSSSKLSNDTVNSIINALKNLTGTTSQTLTLHTTVKNNLTQAQKNAIAAKNWQLV